MQKRFYIMYFIAVFVKLAPLGFIYRPLQDDYIQYYGYAHYPDIYRDVIQRIGILNVRPLAGLFDVYVLSRFWGNMSVLLIMFTLLHYASFMLFERVFDMMGCRSGEVFALVYLLSPIAFEGVYWISAASRIVVSLFFVSAMLYAVYKDKIVPFAVCMVFAMGFYEQTAVLGSFMLLWVLTVEALNGRRVRKYIYVSIAVWLAVVIYYVAFARTGELSARVNDTVFSVQSVKITLTEIIRGWKSSSVLLTEGIKQPVLILVLAGLISVIIGFGNGGETTVKSGYKFCVGAVLFCVSYAVHILTGAQFVPYRCHLPSLIGLALMSDVLGGFLRINVRRVLISLVMFVFLVANIYQADCYRRIWAYDEMICADVADGINDENKSGDIYIYNVKPLYIEVPDDYKRYILKNVTESDWALTGAVRAKTHDMGIKRIIPAERRNGDE